MWKGEKTKKKNNRLKREERSNKGLQKLFLKVYVH